MQGPTLFMTVGLPGTGKTTAARRIEVEEQALRLTKDEWVRALYGRLNPPSAQDVIEGRLVQIGLRALELGINVVIDFGLWGRDERSALRQAAADRGAVVEMRYFELDPAEQRSRLDHRQDEAPHTTWPMSDEELAEWSARIDVPTPGELDGSEPIDDPPSGFATWDEWRRDRWPMSVMSHVSAPSQGDGDLAARLQAALDRAAAASTTPGTQAALVRDGLLVWAGTSGFAHVETWTPVTRETVFCLASLGKTMLAALTLRLVEDGVLDLDQRLAAILGDRVPGAQVVTVRMLLTHTAGYPDLYESPEVSALMPPMDGAEGSGSAYDPDRPYTWEMLAAGLREPVEPGARWEYSNTGYVVLCEVLTRALGGADGLREAWTSLADRVDGEVRLTPDLLTMERAATDPARLAHGYDRQADGSYVDPYALHRPAGVPTDLFGLPFGDGLFAGTAVGTAAFLDGLFVRQSLLDPATVHRMSLPTAQAAADASDPDLRTYAMGTFAMSAAGGVWQGHRGGYGGFSTAGASRRADGTTLVVLTNGLTEERPALVIWRELAGLV